MSLVGPETQNVPNEVPVSFRLSVTPGVAQSFLFFKIINESKCKKNNGFYRFET